MLRDRGAMACTPLTGDPQTIRLRQRHDLPHIIPNLQIVASPSTYTCTALRTIALSRVRLQDAFQQSSSCPRLALLAGQFVTHRYPGTCRSPTHHRVVIQNGGYRLCQASQARQRPPSRTRPSVLHPAPC